MKTTQTVRRHEAEHDGGLRPGLRSARVPGEDGCLDDVRGGRATGPRVDEMVTLAVRPCPAMHADAGRGQAVARAERCTGQDEDSELRAGRSRVGHADFPCIAFRAPDGEVAVGVDQGAGVPVEERQGTVGDPALGHPVEVERDARVAMEEPATVPNGLEAPGGPRRQTARARGRAGWTQSCIGGRRRLRRQALAEQRGVYDPAGEFGRDGGPPQRGSQRGADRRRAAQICVGAHQVRGHVVASQAAGPGPYPGRDVRCVELGRGEGRIVCDRHVDAEAAAHGPGTIHGPRKRDCRGVRRGRGGGRADHGFAPDWLVTTGAGIVRGAGGATTVASPALGVAWPGWT
jgi:hypothetical protein